MDVTATDDVFAGGGSESASITNATGGNFENLVTDNTPVNTNVLDDNDAPVLTLTGDTSVAEGDPANFTLTISEAPVEDFEVTVVIGEDTTNGDVTPITQTITILAGETTATFTVDNVQDNIVEVNEDFNVTVTDTAGGGFEALPTNPPAVTTTIIDDDSAPTLSVGDATVSESDGTISFEVTLSSAAAVPVTVDFATNDGTAVDADDFDATNGSLTFAPGETTQTITVDLVDDVFDEIDENFTVVLSNPTDAIIADGTGDGTITDDVDNTNLVLTGPASVTEGETITYTATLSNPAETPVTVTLSNGETITIAA